MRRVQFVAVVVTLAIATPLTGLAILLSATITDNIVNITRSLYNLPQHLVQLQRNLLFETELIGLVAGTVILLTILLLTVRTNQSENKTSI
jgi:hypothetical protein